MDPLLVWPIVYFNAIFCGYILSNSMLQLWYYRCQASRAKEWKIQSNHDSSLRDSHQWWLPLLIPTFQHKNRAPLHNVFASINLIIASSFAAFTSYCTVKGLSQLYTHTSHHDDLSTSIVFIIIIKEILLLLVSLVWQSIFEYYWHILMHTRYCYTFLHKHHHYYKSPEPFDDMYIHPLESTGYYCILYSPAFIIPQSVYTFLAYMSLLGTFGILDHSGIHFSIPWLYDTADHDAHHQFYSVNYAFPFPYMDLLHKTYTGTFAGKVYDSRRRNNNSHNKSQ